MKSDNISEKSSSFIATVISEPGSAGNNESTLYDYDKMKVLPLRDSMVLPGIPQPVAIGREKSIKLLESIVDKKEAIFVTLQKDIDKENPSGEDLNEIGVICRVINFFESPDGQKVAFLFGLERGRLSKVVRKRPFLTAKIIPEPEIMPLKDDQEFMALMSAVDEKYQTIINFVGEEETRDIRLNISQHSSNILSRFRFMVLNSPLTLEEKQNVLNACVLKEQLEIFLKELDISFQKMEIKAQIASRTHEDMTRQQKENFLLQQIRAIQDELGNDDSDEDELRRRADSKKWNDEDREYFDKELKKLQRYNPQSPEYAVQYSYLDTFLTLPWQNYSEAEISMDEVERVLGRDHYGLEKVKERILEHIAVLKLRKDMKSPILCLYGPPGVGKTSLGKSIAEALRREYARVSLGGLHDEAEIRGHRRTYIGAMPGRIISALVKCGTGNPVFVLDEIDKIGHDFKGDPSMALLEVLDPEQNIKFHDNYIDHDYDLSKILFIATANDLSGISAPLRDRMEIIDIGGYITQEKIEIAIRHLIPKNLNEHGFPENEISFEREAVEFIIESYTRENGVRQLDKKIAKVIRKIARLKASDTDYPKVINTVNARDFLGKEEVFPEIYENNDFSGVVTGLAWTQTGGDILFIEASVSPGKGDKLTLTGNLGDVMKESAVISMQYLRAHAEKFGIDREKLDKSDIHIHVPEGAVPKDGPSAGITMATALVSALTGRKVRSRLAMTGEMTLRGKVLPVGGIKEKILAAKRAGITDIILSDHNRKDIEEINPSYLEGMSFLYVERVEEVLNFALLDELALY